MENNKVGQEQIHDLLFGEKLSWQAIIYDLVNSEQLDPWDINIALLVDKYLGRIRELEEANFFVSSKVLLAASILLRMKSDILLHQDIPTLDDILFGKKEEKKYVQERIELDDEIPYLIPRTPLPRFKRVTLQELMSALGNAIKTENRRIKRTIVLRQQEFETQMALPRGSFSLESKIKEIYNKIRLVFKEKNDKIPFFDIEHKDKHDRILAFVSLLHLDNQQKVWLEQEDHFEEIWIWMKDHFMEKNKENFERMRKEVEESKADEPEYENDEEIHVNISEIDKFTGFGKSIE